MEMSKTNGEVQIMNTQIENFECLDQGRYIGLAAQSNVIWDTLTVDEHLEFIGKAKGMENDEIEFQKDFIKKTLDLTPFGDKLASQLSGGNKRKLCSAVSLMSNPTVEFLDEPTTGVDPIARRSLFKMLKQLKNSSILLTTHRMDEAESLCDKIAIMINGKFVCYGSPSHLKQKYG
jgi:ATP-binding cassette, subfamily A (ABC1), member 3